jgi:hypothetical protein
MTDDLLGGPFAFTLGKTGIGVGEGDEPGDEERRVAESCRLNSSGSRRPGSVGCV